MAEVSFPVLVSTQQAQKEDIPLLAGRFFSRLMLLTLMPHRVSPLMSEMVHGIRHSKIILSIESKMCKWQF